MALPPEINCLPCSLKISCVTNKNVVNYLSRFSIGAECDYLRIHISQQKIKIYGSINVINAVIYCALVDVFYSCPFLH